MTYRYVLYAISLCLFISGCTFFNDNNAQEAKIAELGSIDQKHVRTSIDFFEMVMGMPEHQFKKLPQQQKEQFIDRKNKQLINIKTKQRFAYGDFKTLTIKELRERAEQKEKPGNGTFKVIEGVKPWVNESTRINVDVAALQADPKNNDAVFQVASNFNALEGGGDPAAGMMNYLDPFLFVQGETAAISAAPGLIYRMYYANPVNFLDVFDGSQLPSIPVHNGYVGHISDENVKKIGQARSDLLDYVKVGFHANMQPTLGLSKLKNEQPEQGRFSRWALAFNPNQRIDQVFTAAMNLSGLDSNHYEPVARMLLNAAYEGTLKSAFINGKKNVFLTLIGGGVFDNKLSWIGDAIVSAVKNFVKDSGMNVTLVIYDSSGHKANEFATFKKQMLDLVNQTNGSYLKYTENGVYQVK